MELQRTCSADSIIIIMSGTGDGMERTKKWSDPIAEIIIGL